MGLIGNMKNAKRPSGFKAGERIYALDENGQPTSLLYAVGAVVGESDVAALEARGCKLVGSGTSERQRRVGQKRAEPVAEVEPDTEAPETAPVEEATETVEAPEETAASEVEADAADAGADAGEVADEAAGGEGTVEETETAEDEAPVDAPEEPVAPVEEPVAPVEEAKPPAKPRTPRKPAAAKGDKPAAKPRSRSKQGK